MRRPTHGLTGELRFGLTGRTEAPARAEGRRDPADQVPAAARRAPGFRPDRRARPRHSQGVARPLSRGRGAGALWGHNTLAPSFGNEVKNENFILSSHNEGVTKIQQLDSTLAEGGL